MSKLLPFVLLPLLVACSDQRATFEIKGSAHSLSLIRVTTFPWDNTASYALVASRMPDCLRKHPMPDAGLNARVEIFSPGNDAWIIRQGGRLFVAETRSCEGFAKLDKEPEEGLGTPAGVFEMRGGTLVFTPAPLALPVPPAAAAPTSSLVEADPPKN